jgi:hypothetical protein
MPRIRSGGCTANGGATDATGKCLTRGSSWHTYDPAPASYIASHGMLASTGSSMRSTTRTPSPRAAARAAVARYRPAIRPAPNSASNSCCPTSRTGCSVSRRLRRVLTAEARTTGCSSSQRAKRSSMRSLTVSSASPASERTTCTVNELRSAPGAIATSMTLMSHTFCMQAPRQRTRAEPPETQNLLDKTARGTERSLTDTAPDGRLRGTA